MGIVLLVGLVLGGLGPAFMDYVLDARIERGVVRVLQAIRQDQINQMQAQQARAQAGPVTSGGGR